MIRKPLTTITINNDPTANALKPGTQALMKGIKLFKKIGPSGFRKSLSTAGSATRKQLAKEWRGVKSTIGSPEMRGAFKLRTATAKRLGKG